MTTWWSTEKINATISQEYVERELGNLRNREILHRVLKFGDGLTDNTYLEWVLERSPRFFLILNDIGCPEKIFDVIDRSFDDEDLPLSQDTLWELNIFGTKSESLDKKFYRTQYSFLVQELEQGGHVDYGVWDVVPVEPVLKRGQIGATPSTDKVYAYDHLYTRKKIPASGEEGVDRVHFMLHMKNVTNIQHPHLTTVFATYAQDDVNHVLLSPSSELSVKQVFEDQSKQFKLLEKLDRRDIVLTWAHCITSALAYLHEHGFVHGSIRPSNIVVDQNSKIYLTEFAALKALDRDDAPSIYSGDLYDHSPPENWLRKPTLHETAPLKTYLPGGSRTSRRLPKNNLKTLETRPPQSPNSSVVNRSASRSASSSAGSSTSTNARPRNALITTFAPQRAPSVSMVDKQYPADIFSLSTVLLTLLSYLLGHSPKTFASHRCKLNRQAGRGNAPPDASFHKNLKQVSSWMDKLVKEAGHKEKKDVKFWGAVAELVGVCRLGLEKDPGPRPSAAELDKKVGGWVEWGLGRRRRCTCQDKDKSDSAKAEEEAEKKPTRASVRPPIRTAERISYINATPARYWTTVSEDVSTARNSFATFGADTPRGRGSVAISQIGSPPARSSMHANGSRSSSVRNSMASSTMNSMSVHRNSRATTSRRRSSSTEVWGLGEALREEDEGEQVVVPARPKRAARKASEVSQISASTISPTLEVDEFTNDCYYGYDPITGEHPTNQNRSESILEGVVEEGEFDDHETGYDGDSNIDGITEDGDDEDLYTETGDDDDLESHAANKNWPLPLGALRFADKAISVR